MSAIIRSARSQRSAPQTPPRVGPRGLSDDHGLWPSCGDPRVTAVVPIAGLAYTLRETGSSDVAIPMMAIGGHADTRTPFDRGSGPSYDHASRERKALAGFSGPSTCS